MTKSSIAIEYNEINENGRNGWIDKYQVNAFFSQHRESITNYPHTKALSFSKKFFIFG